MMPKLMMPKPMMPRRIEGPNGGVDLPGLEAHDDFHRLHAGRRQGLEMPVEQAAAAELQQHLWGGLGPAQPAAHAGGEQDSREIIRSMR